MELCFSFAQAVDDYLKSNILLVSVLCFVISIGSTFLFGWKFLKYPSATELIAEPDETCRRHDRHQLMVAIVAYPFFLVLLAISVYCFWNSFSPELFPRSTRRTVGGFGLIGMMFSGLSLVTCWQR